MRNTADHLHANIVLLCSEQLGLQKPKGAACEVKFGLKVFRCGALARLRHMWQFFVAADTYIRR